MSHVLQKGFITLASRRNNNDMKQKAEDVLIASSFNVDLTQCPKKLRLAVGLNAAAVSSKALETALAARDADADRRINALEEALLVLKEERDTSRTVW